MLTDFFPSLGTIVLTSGFSWHSVILLTSCFSNLVSKEGPSSYCEITGILISASCLGVGECASGGECRGRCTGANTLSAPLELLLVFLNL